VLQSAYIPQLLRIGDKRYKVRWLPAVLNESVRAIVEQVKSLCPTTILYYKIGKEIHQPIIEDYFSSLLSLFLNHFVHTYHPLNARQQAQSTSRLFFNGSLESFTTFESKEYPNAIQLWLSKYYIAEKENVPVLQIEDLDGSFEVQVDVLRDLAMLSDYFPQITQLVASKGQERLIFNSDDFVAILFKILPTIRLFGIKVLLPKALRKVLRPQMSMLLEGDETGMVKKTSIISMENMLRFQWRIALGNRLLTEKEFLQLVKQYSGVWTAINYYKLP